MTNPQKIHPSRAGLPERLQRRSVLGRLQGTERRPLRVMKFGGTSVGDAGCIGRVIEIVRAAWRDSDVVVVVSAMSGVTNKLVAAASHSEFGFDHPVSEILEELRRQHIATANDLISSAAERESIQRRIEELLNTGERLCQGTKLLRELTPRTRDAISSLGERLSVLLVAAGLAERGMDSAAIEATEIVVTDGSHGAADPCIEQTQARCEARLRPLLQQGAVPVVTGFIGATIDGILTTLGRGGSDYSATILGAALEADEVIIWTDVDGLQTADPRVVPSARTLPEVSYREAAELAFFGAKVLHPKTLRPVIHSGIPLWIRNTFAPERLGTRITPAGSPEDGGVKAITAISDVALISVGGPGLAGVHDVVGRTLRIMAAVRADVLLISQASSQNDLCLVIPSPVAKHAQEQLRREFAHELTGEQAEHFKVDPTVALVTVVGQNMKSIPGVVGFTFGALGREQVNIIAIAQGSSDCTVSFVVSRHEMKTAITSIHREFQLGVLSLTGYAQCGESCRAIPTTQHPDQLQ